MKQKKPYQSLQPIAAPELLDMEFGGQHWLVESMLAEGVYILAGAPKIGKSWLVLWLCQQIANGESVWDFETQACTVLYLALEDTPARLQSRLMEYTDEPSPQLIFSTTSATLGTGLANEIRTFAKEHFDFHFLVIDTLQKVRAAPGKDDISYAGDYADLSVLKDLAQELHLCILLVHHTRKMKDDDPFNMIAGTTGLSGAVDGSFVLRKTDRSDTHAEMFCTGRDVVDRKLELQMDKQKMVWQLVQDSSAEQPLQMDESLWSLVSYLRESKQCKITAAMLLAFLSSRCNVEGKNSAQIAKHILKHQNLLKEYGVIVTRSRSNGKRWMSFTYCMEEDQHSDGSDGETVVTKATDPADPVCKEGCYGAENGSDGTSAVLTLPTLAGTGAAVTAQNVLYYEPEE